MLGRKPRNTQTAWTDALDAAPLLISRERVENLVDRAVERVKATVGRGRAGYAWSGGKDSQVLALVCGLAGVRESVISVAHPHLEYASFRWFVSQHGPPGLRVKTNEGVNLKLLARDPALLFPTSKKDVTRYWSRLQWRAVPEFYTEQRLDVMVLGRRVSDGNHIPAMTYTRADGYRVLCPIYDWTHEEVLAAIGHYRLPLPAIYTHEDGFVTGTGPWSKMMQTPARPLAACWRYVHRYDPEAVERAAEVLPSAAAYLRSAG